ncbi:phosphotransferase family protein [Myxococcota bacterium]|nr:phosphotransferase family protein [Myxococcota bacterium]
MVLVPPSNTRPPREAHQLDAAALARWLGAHVPGCAGGDVVVQQFRGGQSNPTYWVGVSAGGIERELVLRKKPPGKLLPSAHAVEREYRIMRALRDTPVPVPNALAITEDVSVLGTPFYVMDFVPGRVFWDPTLPELDGNEARTAVYEQFIGTLAALHTVDHSSVGLGDFGKVGSYVPRQVERWTRQYEASKTGDEPAMDALIAWLSSRTPETDETTLIHGDFRIDNVLFTRGPETPRALAVLDWELSTLGHPISDLAYACMSYHVNLPGRGGLAGVDVDALGIPSEQAFVDRYCALTGRAKLGDWPYFMAFGIFRLAAIAQGVYKRGLQGNASDDAAGSFGEAARFLAELACGIAGVAVHR